MFVVDRFEITPGWSNRTLLINILNKHYEVSGKSKILQISKPDLVITVINTQNDWIYK